MCKQQRHFPTGILCGLSCLFLFVVFVIEVPGGEPISPGVLMSAFTLEDQHGMKHEVNEQVRLILFCKEKKGNDIVSEALKKVSEGYLSKHNTFFVADTSGMPRLVAKFIALPALRKRPYLVLLDPGPSTTSDFPSEKDKVTLFHLQNLKVMSIEFVDNPEGVTRAIEQTGKP